MKPKGEQVKICKWKAVFKLDPERIGVAQANSTPDVKLVTESQGNNTYITSIEITTLEMSFVDAVNYSTRIANRCVDLISYLVAHGVSCSLGQINEIGPPGTVIQGAAFCSTDVVLSRLQNVDITSPSISNVLRDKDAKLARQLSHYRRAIASSDSIEQIREFYQILEDEYGNNHSITEKYKYVRHLVSHAELTNHRSILEALRIFGKTYMDPSDPQDLQVLQSHLNEIKNQAERVIKSKI